MIENEPLETIHVYIVREEEEPVVDSSVQDTTTIATQPIVPAPYPMHVQLVPYLIMAAHLLIVLTAFSIPLYTLLTETATVTIVPTSYHITKHLSLTPLHSRILSPVTLAYHTTVPATGKGHQDATAAYGTLTFFNASEQEQTIDADTLFFAGSIHLVTDEVATIPAAQPPTEGETMVMAHVVTPGSTGNIQAGVIRGACCKENIFVSNSAFSGGADEREYTVVSQQDIAQAVASVVPPLTHTITTDLERQKQTNEVLTPLLCLQSITSDHNAGDEAARVTVTITKRCIAGAYNLKVFHAQVTNALQEHAANSYLLAAFSQTSSLIPSIHNNLLLLSASYQGVLTYHFSTKEKDMLKQQLAGKSTTQATSILNHISGIHQFSLTVSDSQKTIPTNTANIHLVLVYEGFAE